MRQKQQTSFINCNSNRPAISSTLLLVLTSFMLGACGGSSTTERQSIAQSTGPADEQINEQAEVQPSGDPSSQTLPETQSTDESTDNSNNAGNNDTANGNTEEGHFHPEHPIRFTDSNQDIWPPQPLGISNVSLLSAENRKRVRPDTDLKISQLLSAQSGVPSLSGMRYEILTRHDLTDKSGNVTRIDVQVFNYDTNQIVTVEFDPDSTSIIKHSAADAFNYQPPESQAEVAQAIKLAAIDLSRQGFTEHLNLNGTGLLAFPSSVQSAASGTDFYSERKIYVTFGAGNGVLPEYRALVNLSTDTVESSGSIQ